MKTYALNRYMSRAAVLLLLLLGLLALASVAMAALPQPQATPRGSYPLDGTVWNSGWVDILGGDHYASLFGEERARRAIVTREWLEAGVPVALGSDAPTTPWYTPQVTLCGAVTRVTFSNQRLEPAQALTIQEALRAHTMGSAYAAHEEDSKGSIEPGKLADLAVWSDDPYTRSPSHPVQGRDLAIPGELKRLSVES